MHACIHTYIHTYTYHFITHTIVLTFRSFTTSFVFPSCPVPATTFGAHYWKKLTCGVIRSFNFAGIRWHSLLFLPLIFIFSWMFMWAAISNQLQEYIHRIWATSFICQCDDCLKFGNLWGELFFELQIAFF